MTEETHAESPTFRKKSIFDKASQNVRIQSSKLKNMFRRRSEVDTTRNENYNLGSSLLTPSITYEDMDVDEILKSEKSRYERTGCFSPKFSLNSIQLFRSILESYQQNDQLHGNYFEFLSIEDDSTLRKEKLIGSTLKEETTLKFSKSTISELPKKQK
jgi:hypothetical protein